MTEETLYEDEHLRCRALRADHVIVVSRTGTRVESPEALSASYQSAMRGLGEGYRGWGLVLDVREAPGRNENDFERGVEPVRRAALAYFRTMVVLVRSAAGELQVRRMGQNDNRTTTVTHDYDEAIRLAQSG